MCAGDVVQKFIDEYTQIIRGNGSMLTSAGSPHSEEDYSDFLSAHLHVVRSAAEFILGNGGSIVKNEGVTAIPHLSSGILRPPDHRVPGRSLSFVLRPW